MDAEYLRQDGDERDVPLVARLDLPAELGLVADAEEAGVEVEVLGEHQMTQLAGAQAGEHEREEQGELPVVARPQEGPLLLVREQGDGRGLRDGDAADLERSDGVIGIGGWRCPSLKIEDLGAKIWELPLILGGDDTAGRRDRPAGAA